jgi:hypothetical protein
VARKTPLRAVTEDDAPLPPAKPQSVDQAVNGTERDLLISLRSHLARELGKGAVPAHALASVSAKIREFDREIRAIDARDEQEAKTSGGPTPDEAWTAI